MSISENGVIRLITFDTIVNGCDVNCSDSNLAKWRRLKKLNENDFYGFNVILMGLECDDVNSERY